MTVPIPFIAALLILAACGRDDGARRGVRVTLSGSAVGAEAELLRLQLDTFAAQHPDIRVDILPTPDAAEQRHQLYVQWLNARTPDPDVLQLDVIWTAEFPAAGRAISYTVPYAFAWQGARYEGLTVVFLEHLHAFGGRVLDEEGGCGPRTRQPFALSPSCGMPSATSVWSRRRCPPGTKRKRNLHSRTADLV